MIFLLLLFALFHRLHGAPLDQMDDPSSSINPPLLPRSRVKFGTRTESDIIITCLATIFACTWTTMHPNVPSPVDSGWDILKRRIRWVFYALLAPELITTLAFRQRIAASAIVKRYNKDIVEPSLPAEEREARRAARESNQSATRWRSIWSLCTAVAAWLPAQIKRFFTRRALPQERQGRIEEWTTAHGFFVQMGGFMLSKDGQPLQTLSDTDEIVWRIQGGKAITTTQEDIQDRSKGDAISKGFVILQTTWFFTQCIARWSTGLVVTELEVVTLGFVVLNGLTYTLWWDKPQNVNVPVYLERIGNNVWKPEQLTRLYKLNVFLHYFEDLRSKLKFELPTSMKEIGALLVDVTRFVLFVIPITMASELLAPVVRIIAAEYPGDEPILRVSMFSSANIDQMYQRFLTLSMVFIAVMFATVHLAPSWSLHFPSHRYTVLWRTCVIVTAAVPPTIIPVIELSDVIGDSNSFSLILILLALSYFASRIALFVVALVALRNIPSGALITIDWLSIFPHI